MPKIVDHEKQKEKVAEAAWRAIRMYGMEGATVRKIADEAGLSVGSMRHYFSSQSELFSYSMSLVSERISKRIHQITFTGQPFKDAQLILFELLPLDEEKRAEMEVWLKFNTKALSDPALLSHSARVYAELKMGITHIIDTFIHLGYAKENLDREKEIDVLYALIDGLALHGILQPGQMPAKRIEATVQHQLASICKPEKRW
ncbi:TetR family transcriptional regulator C-terminal domain-containing protein [Cytobacillus spongiae]|jgi:AcrR family transcriptional regulator|uniref:TetR/AcrR family transcriptional regulator n=1 Tax=Cytobacillus spongiae TaxID=2901381 RepID=UPI001F288E05|nr:TetR family transcriptional regulator C-terminal domain-containing protein [Cytobacillus spongiae]UII55943.1 TetR family transcriptional regulator C-terminal domain-containing protein [Cytobacillus spongiae]